MGALRTILGGLADGMTPDGTMVRHRMRTRLDMLITMVVSVLAVAIAVAYQVVRHMPESWRRSLLGDGPQQE